MFPGAYDPDRIAITMAGSQSQLTYGEVEAFSNQFARLCRHHGLKQGDGIALCLENHLYFLPICWGAFRAGLYFTAISYRLQPAEVEYIVNDSGAKILITSAHLTEQFEALAPNLVNEPACYMLDGQSAKAGSLLDALSELPTTRIPDETCGQSLLYSSGTTGRPKGVKKPLPPEGFGDPIPYFTAAEERYQFDESTIYLSPAPLYHAAPLGFTMNVLRFGGKLVVMEQFNEALALDYIDRYEITHSQWVPTMFVRMLKLPEDEKTKLLGTHHRCAVHAAAPCPVSIKQQMIAWWGPIIFEYYAGTEGNGSTFIDSDDWLAHPGSVGRASPGCTVHILDDDGEEVPQGETGGVYFEGGGQFVYLNDDEKTKGSYSKEGWSTLGDIGHLDEEGYLYLTDRKSFMIISGGVNIYPQEAENVLITHPKVTDVAVFGVPNSEFGEEVKAVVQPVDMALADASLEAELIAYARDQISHIKCPRSIDFLEALPRHPTGKLYKRLLKDKYWENAS